MKFLPSVVSAEHRGAFRLHVVFNDGSENTIDFTEWLEGPVFEPLKDAAFFRRFFVDGGTVAWPNGADVAPEALYAVAGRRQRTDERVQPTKARRSVAKKRVKRVRLRG
jgi:hypothetical protein